MIRLYCFSVCFDWACVTSWANLAAHHSEEAELASLKDSAADVAKKVAAHCRNRAAAHHQSTHQVHADTPAST